jgi:hypothetical protein
VTSSVCPPALVQAARATKPSEGFQIASPFGAEAGAERRKLPMWTQIGKPASSARAQNGSSSDYGNSEPFGKDEITAPLWPLFIAYSSSAIESSRPVVGRMA